MRHPLLISIGVRLLGIFTMSLIWINGYGYMEKHTLKADGPRVVINEVAWAGTAASSNDEWIELYNAGDMPVDLTGWQLRAADGTPSISLHGLLSPGGFLLLERTDDETVRDVPADLIYSGALNNQGEQLWLLDDQGQVVDSANADGGGWPAGSSGPEFRTMERVDPTMPDRDDNWTSNDGLHRWGVDANGQPINGTPRGPNSTVGTLPTPSIHTPTPTPTETAILSPSPTATATPSPSPTATTLVTPQPTSTETTMPPIIPGTVRLNEVLPAPRSVDWDGDGTATAEDEWIELYNLGEEAVLLGGWQLDDVPDGGSRPYTIPAGTILPAYGYLLLFRRDTKIALNNDADEVRLLAPDGTLRDQFAYLHTRPDTSFARTVDGIGGWTDIYSPSPGQPNRAPTPTPAPSPVLKTVFLNEILPAPRERDWDGDGAKTTEDEWIELINLGETMVDLGGWVLDDVPDGGSKPYVFPVGSFVPARGYRLVFRRESKVALNNNADQVRLLSPDGQEVDRFEWSRSPGYDRALGRQPDGTGEWVSGLIPSPGGPNPPRMTSRPRQSSDEPTLRPQLQATHTATPWVHITPTPTVAISLPPLMTIAQVRRQSDGQEVRVRGQVTVPPEVFGRSIYIQDSSGGIQVYMSRSEWPALRLGDWIEVQGHLVDFHGEREIKISSSAQLRIIGPGAPPVPVLLRGDQLGEIYEGMLVMVVGRVSGFGRQELRLSDHYGEVRVYVREAVGWRRPWVERGDWWSAIGVVSQYAIQKPYVGGYRLLPRYRDDLAPMPMYLPEIGLTSPAEDSPR